MEITLEELLPFLLALPGTISGIALLGWQIKKFRAEVKDKEANAAERFTNAAIKLVDIATGNVSTLEDRITILEDKVGELSDLLDSANENMHLLLSVIDWLLDGIKMLTEQIRSANGEPLFELDEKRLMIVDTIKVAINGGNLDERSS